ncbi:MAG: hypothetical protein NTW29_19105 [Bacteroidetes bacterium]|nr:hypothetical protein [Bacteroidota bacterium]
MKKNYLLILLLLISGPVFAQPGKYAGTKRSLIGKTYVDGRDLSGLKGWEMMQSTLMSGNAGPEFLYVSVFTKGTTSLVVIAINDDTASEVNRVIDVMEITGVQKGWSIRVASCYQGNVQDNYLIVWAKDNTLEYSKLIKKAWRFNPDKRRIIPWPIKNIKCENIGC